MNDQSKLLKNAGIIFVLLSATLVGGNALAANTGDVFSTTATDLSVGTNFVLTISPTSALTTDLQFSGVYTAGTTFTIGGGALNFGTLNDVNATQSLVISNAIAAPGSITLNMAANSTAGSNASDLLYVALGGNLTIQSGVGTVVLNLVTTGNIDNAGTLSLAAPLSIAAATTTTFTGAGTTTVSGNITSAGSVVINNAGGSVTLSGNNAYTGTTAINSGTLNVSNIVVTGGISNLGAAVTAVTLGGISTTGLLNYMGNTATYLRGFSVNAGGGEVDTATSGQTLTIGTGNIVTSSGLFTLGGAGNTSITSVIGSGSGGLSKTGTGTLSLSGANTYSGATNINGGVVQISAANNLGSAAATNTLGFNGGTLESTANNYSLGTTRTITLNGGGTIQVDSGNLTVNGVISGAGTLTETGSGTLTLSGANTSYTGVFVQSAGILSLANTAALNSSNTVTVNGGTFDLNGTATETIGSLSGTGGTVTNSSGSTASVLTLGGSGTTTYSGTISAPSAAANPTVLGLNVALTGNGSQTLSGSNTYTGLTTVNSGTLIAGSSNAFGNGGLVRSIGTGGTTVNAGGAVDLNGQAGINEVLTLNGTGVGANGALINNSAISASIGNGVSSLNVSGAFTGLSAGTTASIAAPTSGATATATAVLGVTAASFNINGGSTIYLTAPTVTISGGGGVGATAVANLNGLGVVTGITITNPGSGFTTVPTIAFSGGTTSAVLTNPTGTGVDGHFTLDGIAITNNGSGYTTTPTVTLSSGSVTTSANLASVALASNSSIGGSGNMTINAVISGSGTNLTKIGMGTLTLSNLETYTGGTVINGGTLAVGLTNALASSTSLSVANSAGLSLGSNNTTVNGNVTLTSGSITGSGTLTASSAGTSYTVINGSVSVILGGAGDALTKTSDGTSAGGTVILSGANSYTGATAINGGMLEVDGSLATGSAVTIGGVSSSATPTLTGAGTINGAVTVASAGGGAVGTINPGTVGTIGTLTVGSITFQNGSILALDLSGATCDLLNISHVATINSGAEIQITGSGLNLGNYVLATAASGLNGNAFTVLGSLPSGYALVSSATALDLQHLSVQSFTLPSPAVINIFTGATTAVGAMLTNTAPLGSANLAVNLADNGGTGGVVSSLGSSSGSTIAPLASSTITGTFTAGTAGLGETWSIKNTDSNAVVPVISTGGIVNVYNHATPTLTIATGNNQSGIVGSTLSNATLILADTGTVPAPLDVNTLSNLTGTTGLGVIGSGSSGTYTSTVLNTSTAGLGQTLVVSLKAGDQQTITGANPLTTLSQSVIYNVYNHATPTLTIATGNNQSGIVGSMLANATLTLADATGILPAPLDVNTLSNLTGTTGLGVIGSGGTGTYTSTVLNTSTAGLGQTLVVSLKAGDQQTITGANLLGTLGQTITYNVYNHSTPTLTIATGNNQSGIVGSMLANATLTLADATGILPAPLDVNMLSNLTGATGLGVIGSGGTGTYTSTVLNTSTAGLGQTLVVSLKSGDQQTITGANPLGTLGQTITYNVYNHSTPTLTIATGNNQSGIVGSMLSNATLTLADITGTVPAPLDVNMLSNLTGTTGSGVVGSGTTGAYTSTVLNTSTAGLGQTLVVSLKAGDQQTITGANPLTTLSQSVIYNVYNHATPTLTIATGNNQSGIVGSTLANATLTLADATGILPAPLDVNTLSNLTGTTGLGVIGSGSSGTYTSTVLNTSTVGLGQTLVVSLKAGDQQTITGANPLGPLSQNITYNVYNHATSNLTSGTLSLGDIHAGYADPVTSGNSLTATNGTVSDVRVNLQGSATALGNISLNSLSGIASGGSGTISAMLATGQGLGAINTNLTYTFADQSAIAGALNNVGTASITVTGQVYSGNGAWAGNGTSSGLWGTLISGFGANWGANQGSPGLDTAFTNTDTATFGNVGGQSTQLVSLDGANPSLNSITFDASSTSYTFAQGTGGTLSLNGGVGAATITDVATGGTQTISAPVNLTTNANVNVASGRQLALSGVISGAGGLTTTGPGVTTLSGNNSYLGATTVRTGILQVDGSLAAGSSVTIGGALASGTPTLTGTGTVNGAVTVASAGGGVAGTINPGGIGTIGTLTLGSITFQSGSTLALDMSGTNNDLLTINHAATINSGADLQISASNLTLGTYVLATAASGLNGNAFTILGALPSGYELVATSTTLDLQHLGSQSFSLPSPATINIIAGATTPVSATLTNGAPVGSVALVVNLVDNGGTGGVVSSLSSSSGATVDSGASSTVTGTLTAGNVGAGETWSIKNTDLSAVIPTVTTSGTVNVYNHSTPTLTISSGNNQSGIVGSTLANATLTLADTTGTVSAPLDVNTLSNLTGTTGSGVVGSGGTGIYTSTALNTSTVGIGQTLTIGLNAGDQQTITGANPLSTLNQTISYNVYNHATPTLTITSGNSQSGIVGSTLANATLTLTDTTGTVPAPLDVNTLSHLTGVTGSGVIGSGSSGLYTSTAFNTSTAGIGQILAVSLKAGDQQTITGADLLSTLAQTITYNVYNHSTPTLTIASGNNQSVFVNGTISGPTLTLADTGTIPAPLDVNTLVNLTGASGTGIIGSGSSGTYIATGFDTSTAGLGQTLGVSLKAGDQQTITGANSLGMLSQTVTYNVYNHATPTFILTTGNNQSGIVGSTLAKATLTLSDAGTVPAPLDVNTLSNLTGATGSGVIGSGSSGVYTSTTLDTSMAGLGQTLAVSLNAGDQQTIPGADPLSTLGQTITYNVYNHSTPTLAIATGNNQSIFVNGTITSPTLTLADTTGTLPAPLDVNTLSHLTGATGSGVIGSGSSGTYTASGFNTSIASLGQTLDVSLIAGDQQTIMGANPLSLLSQNITYNVYNHATSNLTSGTLSLGNIHAGYTSPVTSGNSLTATNGAAGDVRVDLQGSAPSVGNISLNSLSGIVSGGSGAISAMLATGQGLGAINTNLTYTFADESSIVGALNNVGTASITITGEIYSGQGVWAGNGTSSGSWGTLTSGFGLNWGANQGSPGLDATFTTTDSATFGNIGSQSSQLVTLNGANPSLNSITFNASSTSYTLAQGSGGTLSLNGGVSSATIADAATGDTQTISAPVNLATNTIVNVSSGQKLTISGNISGIGGITTTGAGATILTGANTYTGATAVNSGVLEVDGSLAAGSTPTIGGTMASGTPTLTGTGTVSGSVTVATAGGGAAGTINPGGIGMIGTLTVGSVSFQNGSILTLDMSGGSSDRLAINNAATISAGADLEINASNLTSGNYVLATAVNGLSVNAFTVSSALPSGYELVATGTTLDLQHLGDQGFSSVSPSTISMITGAITTVSAVLTNGTPAGSASLAVNLADNGGTGGVVSSFNSSSGSTVAGGSGSNITGTLTAGAVGTGETWSVKNTDLNAVTPTVTAGGTVNVYNHSTATLTIASGDNQSGIVGSTLANATLTLANTTGTLPAPLDVNTLSHLTGTTGAGVVASGSSSTYTSTTLNTSTPGVGQTLTVSLMAGDQQTIVGANPLNTLSQNITYNIYNHSTPTLIIASGNNQSVFVSGTLTSPTLTLADTSGTVPAPLDVNTLSNLTGTTGSGVVGSGSSGIYTATGFNTSTAEIGQTLDVSLKAGDQQTITGASPLAALSQTITYNVYNHTTPTLAITNGNNQSGIVGSTLADATLILSDTGSIPAPLDVNTLSNLTGATGSGLVASGGSSAYTSTALNTSTAGIGQTLNVSLKAGDQQTIPGANPLSTLSQTVTYNIYNHSTPTLTIVGGNSQSVFVNDTISGATLTLADIGTVPAPLDVNTLSHLTGATGSGVIGSGSSGTYTATGFNTSSAGLGQTHNVSLNAGDQQTITGAGPLRTLTQTITYNVFNHATSNLTSGTLSLGTIHAGYVSPVTSSNSLTATNGTVSENRVDLQGSAPSVGNISLTSLSSIASGGSGMILATLATGQSPGAINTNLTYTFADQSSIANALNNVGTASITVTGQVYSGQGVWAGNGTSSGSWGTLVSGFGSNWSANQGSPGLDANFTSTDTAIFGNVGGHATQFVMLNGANPSLNSMTFDASTTSYTLAQGTGGTVSLNGGAGSATITDVATGGTQTITAPVGLATNTNVNVASGRQLTISGVITGAGGLTTTGPGMTILSGSDSYLGATTVGAGTLVINGATLTTGTVAVANGGTLAGTGSTGIVTVAGGGNINLRDGAIGMLTVNGLNLGNAGTPSVLSFDIGGGAAGNLDQIVDHGTLTLNGVGGTTINIGSVSGTPALVDGTYTLISSNSLTGSLIDLSLSTTTLDGKSLSLSQAGNSFDLVITDLTTTTTYDLAASAANNRIMVNSGSTTVTSTITNTGSADTVTYTGLNATTSGGSLTGGTLPQNGGPVAANGGTASGTRILTAGGATGVVTITPTVASAVNTTLGGNAILDSTTTATVDVVANRVVTATPVAFGRVLIGQQVNAVSILSTTGDDANFTRVTVGTAGPDSNGISATGGTTPLFNNASVTDTRTVGGAFSTAGSVTNNLTLPTTGEGLVGEAPINVTLNYTADPVSKRVITNGATTNLGTMHSGTTISATSNAFTTTGTHDTTTDVTVAAGSGAADGNGIVLTGGATTFDGTISLDTRILDGTITSATGGTVSGSFDLAVTTLENGGMGLAGEGSYNSVSVGYTAFVYTGQGVWNASGSGTWGTILAPTNWTTNGGAPGLDPNFISTDSATFGNSIGAATATVTLAGDNPSLNTITFSNTLGGSYTIAQGSGGTLVLNNGAGTALINNLGGNNTISAPVQIESNTSVAAAGSSMLTLAGAISEQGGSFGLTVNGTGTVILSGNNNYSGGTTLSSGTLDVTGSGTLGASTDTLTVAGGTLDLGGTSQMVGAVNITGAGTIQTGILTGSSYSDSAPSGTATVSATLAGSGALTMSGGGTLALNGANTYSGGTIISSGTLTVGNLTALGTGDVSMSGGTLETGNGIHEINVAGNYTQTGGTLVLNLSGTTAGASPGYDFLNVAGTASLGGALQIVVLSPYVPRNGDSFDFVQAGTITGGFTSITSSLASLSVTGQGIGGVTITQLPFATLSGITYTSNQFAVAAYVDTGFQNGASSHAFQTLLGALNSLTATGASPSALPNAFDQLTTEKFSEFARSTIFNNASFSMQLFDSYLENQRCRENGFLRCKDEIDSNALTVLDSSMDPGLAQVSSRLLAWSPAPLPHGLLSDTSNPVMAGVDPAMPIPMSASGKERAFNLFIMGNVILAQNFSQTDLTHSDTTTGAVQIGVDYLITPHVKVGALMGFGHTDATLDNIGSKATIDTYSPGVYAAFADKGWYANAMASYGFNSLTEDRHVSFGGLSGIAHGAPSGSQIIGDLDDGYDFHMNKITFGPIAGVQYTHYDINSYTEGGSDPVDLHVDKEQTDSLRSRLGGHVSCAFKAGKVTLKPHLDAFWQHEFLDQSRGTTSQFTSVGEGSFTTVTPSPSRDSALIDGGLNADLNGRVSLYLDYVVQVGQSNYFGQSVQAGVRVAF